MALGANSQNLWQSQLAAVAARQLSQQDRERPNLPAVPQAPPPVPPPLASLQPQISSNEIQAIQQALQQQQQNIQQHLQNLLLLQQGSSVAGNNNVPSPFMGNQVLLGWSLFDFLGRSLFNFLVTGTPRVTRKTRSIWRRWRTRKQFLKQFAFQTRRPSTWTTQ